MRLNADLGEDPRAVVDGTQEALIALVDEANVACGGHAGDDETMRATVAQCVRHGVAVGAHPSYPDRAGFGRVSMAMPAGELERAVREQIDALARIAGAAGVALTHVKPHGALYHDAARDPAVAGALVAAVRGALPSGVALVLPAGAPTRERCERAGVPVVAEGFADRGMRDDGSLIPRGMPGAVIEDPAAAAAQAAAVVAGGGIDTLCVHGDTPGALAVARAVRARLGA